MIGRNRIIFIHLQPNSTHYIEEYSRRRNAVFRRRLPGDPYDLTAATEVTANSLADGAVVYRTAEGTWTRDIDSAAVVSNAEVATALLSAAKADGVRAVDVYVAPVKLDGQHIRPANLREAIRLRGPTIDLPFSFGI
jgi:DNA-binding LacI/PurR family transcriptional regulator